MISIIIPVYNVEKYLEKCLNSILLQSYCDFEAILIDDGSTDASGMICDQFVLKDNRFKVIHKVNGGLSSARNAGLMLASGAYISFIDSDDWIDKMLLEKLVDLIEIYQADIAVCELCSEEGHMNRTQEKISLYSKDEYMKDFLTDKIQSYFCGKLFMKRLFAENDFPEGKHYEDLLLMPQIIKQTSTIVVTDQSYYFYFRDRPDNITNLPSNKVKNQISVAQAFRYRYEIANKEYKDLVHSTLRRATISSMYAYSILGGNRKSDDFNLAEMNANYNFIYHHYSEIKRNHSLELPYKMGAFVLLHFPGLYCKVVSLIIK